MSCPVFNPLKGQINRIDKLHEWTRRGINTNLTKLNTSFGWVSSLQRSNLRTWPSEWLAHQFNQLDNSRFYNHDRKHTGKYINITNQHTWLEKWPKTVGLVKASFQPLIFNVRSESQAQLQIPKPSTIVSSDKPQVNYLWNIQHLKPHEQAIPEAVPL